MLVASTKHRSFDCETKNRTVFAKLLRRRRKVNLLPEIGICAMLSASRAMRWSKKLLYSSLWLNISFSLEDERDYWVRMVRLLLDSTRKLLD